MLIVLSTSLIVVHKELSLRTQLMKSNSNLSCANNIVVVNLPTLSLPNQITDKAPLKSNLSVKDPSQTEKRHRILKQKSSTETSGLGSSLEYTSADEGNNQSASNSRRQSFNCSSIIIPETKVSQTSISNRKVSWRVLPPTQQGLSKVDNFTLETIDSSGSSHANNDHSTPQSLSDLNHLEHSGINQYQQATIGHYFQEFAPRIQETTVRKFPSQEKIFYDSDLDFGTFVFDSECVNLPGPKLLSNQEDSNSKRKSFQIKSNSSDSDKTDWNSWTREKKSESSKRISSEFCQLFQNKSTKSIDCSEFQSLIPKSNYSEMDQSLNNGSNVTYTNNNPSTSQSSNQQSYTETMQISATYLAELAKKSSEKKRKEDENRLTHEQIHYLVEYWDHDLFVRLRTWALFFGILAVGLQIFVGISGSWSFFGDGKHPNYSGLWITCIPENHTCTARLPFISPDTGYRDSILCLLTVSTIFSIGGSGLSFSGLCVTALARKLYYYHSAGEIFFVSGMTMALAASLYSITVEIHLKFYKHRYGYTFWLAWLAALLLLLSAINLLLDELIQGSTKLRSCSCLAKCFRCCCSVNRTQNSETGSQVGLQCSQPPISLQRTISRRHHSKSPPITVDCDKLNSQSKLHNNICNSTTAHWRSDNNIDIDEDFV